MSNRKFDSDGLVIIVFTLVLLVGAGFLSGYAARQSSRYMALLIDKSVGAPTQLSSWETIREGSVLGRSLPKKGLTSYVILASRPDSVYRAIANVDSDGILRGFYPLGGSNGFAYAKRFNVLLQRMGKSVAGSDLSPLDASLEPLITDTLDSITRLERDRVEALIGNK